MMFTLLGSTGFREKIKKSPKIDIICLCQSDNVEDD